MNIKPVWQNLLHWAALLENSGLERSNYDRAVIEFRQKQLSDEVAQLEARVAQLEHSK